MGPDPISTHSARGGARRAAGPLAIALAAAATWIWCGDLGPDLLIDFGREIYLAWRLAAGDVLYRDLEHLNGPLSPYWNALWLQTFGTSLRSLVASNAIVAIAIAALLYRLIGRVASPLASAAACLVFVTIFAFTPIDGVGNFDYLTPYSHGITHGLLLSLLAIAAISLRERAGAAASAACGVCLGLVFLTKPEVFAAAAAAIGAALGLAAWSPSDRDRRRAGVDAVVVIACALLPIGIAWACLSLAMPGDRALRGILQPWLFALNPEARALRFYSAGLGTDDLGRSLAALAAWTAGLLAFLAGAAGLAMAAGRMRSPRGAAAGIVLVASAAALAMLDRGIWPHVAHPLPLVLLGIGAWALARLQRERRVGLDTGTSRLLATLVVFALALLAKMILNARLLSYGFVLAMPATLLAVAALLDWLPAWLERRGGSGAVFRAAAVGALLAIGFGLLAEADRHVRTRSREVGDGPDALRADGRAVYVATALTAIRERVGPEQTLVVLPEGAMLNYWTRRRNPTPFLNFLPLEMVVFGEDRMLAALVLDPPDHVALVHRDTSGYGVRYFGRHYGREIHAWVMRHYQPVQQIGAPPFEPGTRFGITLLQRRGSAPEGRGDRPGLSRRGARRGSS